MFDNIKAVLLDDTVFYALLIVLVGLTSFGLGRTSVEGVEPEEQAATVTMTEAEPSSESASTDGIGERSADGQNAAAGKFVGSTNSDKYHLPWCSGAERINPENQVWFETKAAAEAEGYTPAANCPGL